MSHFLTIPINENGIILDQRFRDELQTAATDPFGFTDVFLYGYCLLRLMIERQKDGHPYRFNLIGHRGAWELPT
jgi:hypothetical protein